MQIPPIQNAGKVSNSRELGSQESSVKRPRSQLEFLIQESQQGLLSRNISVRNPQPGVLSQESAVKISQPGILSQQSPANLFGVRAGVISLCVEEDHT